MLHVSYIEKINTWVVTVENVILDAEAKNDIRKAFRYQGIDGHIIVINPGDFEYYKAGDK